VPPTIRATISGDREADQEAPVAFGLTIAEAADHLGVSENAVRQRIKRGTIPAAKVDGVWRLAVADQEPDRQTDREDRPSVERSADHEATTRPVVVSEAARSQLEAIRDEWLRPLVERIGALERENGRLEAERDHATAERDRLRADRENDRQTAAQLVDLLQAERDELRAEVERLRAELEAPGAEEASLAGCDELPLCTMAFRSRFCRRASVGCSYVSRSAGARGVAARRR